MPSVSPNHPTAPSPKITPGMQHRPGALKRNSSSSAYPLSKQSVASSGSTTGADQQPLKHTARPQRHAKIVLPRNHSSGRNLAKLARQVAKEAHADDGHRHARKRSHEGDTEIRLPGSLDESNVRPPPMRRNMTAYQLPRSSSHVKLKKNLSHGHLSRLPSGKNLMSMTSSTQRTPLSPGLKGKSKRPKSVDLVATELNLHEREEQILREQQEKREGKRKVGFAVGSAGDTTEGEEMPDMDGSGLQEDEWTEESADASPSNTRQNTANNSRRASITERLAESRDEQLPVRNKPQVSIQEPPSQQPQDDESEEQTESASEVTETDDEPPPPQSRPVSKKENMVEAAENQRQAIQPKTALRSPLHAAKEYPNPAARRTLSRNASLPAPALVSNVSALDDRGSPSASMVSSRSNLEGSAEAEDELVSRFIPSGSHPSTGSGANTTLNTPRTSGWHTPTEEGSLGRARGGLFHSGMTSPGSTVSGTSNANTPAHGRSRIEMKMLGEKALADREAAAEMAPTYPHHIYDRRNETLKSYLNRATAAAVADRRSGGIVPNSRLSLGPEIFQGRFKAINTELKVVQRYRDPINECVTRLKQRKGSRLNQRNPTSKQQAADLKASKSAVALASSQRPSTNTHTADASVRRADLAKSESPAPAGGPALPNVKSAVNIGQIPDAAAQTPADIRRSGVRRGVSFAGAPTTMAPRGDDDADDAETGPDAVARHLWTDLT